MSARMKKCGTPWNVGRTPWNKGKKLPFKKRPYQKIPWNKGKKLGPMTIAQRIKISKANKGENSYLWKGGLTAKSIQLRHSIELRLWREAVFARDNWTCQECKIRGGRLEAHHIKSWAKYPELRFAINNGQTLCEKCHKKTDNYLNKKRRSC